MSRYVEIAKRGSTVPKGVALFLGAIFALGFFAMGFDQGHIFSLIQGAEAFDSAFLHELSHDMRHAAGFPCH